MRSLRHPRFRRVAEFPPMVLTSRDAEILRLVGRYRFLRSDHVFSLLEGSRQQLLRRLQMLFHHGYLERPPSQIDYFLQGGSHAMVYGLGNRGAAFLFRATSLSQHRLDWGVRNRTVRRLFLDHALMISDILVLMLIACRRCADVRFLGANETWSETANDIPRHWRVATSTFGEVAIIPDAMFVLRPAGGRDILCVLEADRGTMPVTSQDRERSSLARKFAAYSASCRAGVFRDRFGYSRVRIITVTGTSDRLLSIAECQRSTTGASALFVQTTLAQLMQAPGAFLASLIAQEPRDT